MRVMLLFYLAPLWTVILSRLLLGEVLTPAGVGVMLLSFGGAMIVSATFFSGRLRQQ